MSRIRNSYTELCVCDRVEILHVIRSSCVIILNILSLLFSLSLSETHSKSPTLSLAMRPCTKSTFDVMFRLHGTANTVVPVVRPSHISAAAQVSLPACLPAVPWASPCCAHPYPLLPSVRCQHPAAASLSPPHRIAHQVCDPAHYLLRTALPTRLRPRTTAILLVRKARHSA